MLDQLVAGQSTIEAALSDYANADPTVREQLRSQLSNIAGLRQQVGTASMATLGALQAQIVSIVNNATAAAHEAQASALTGSSSPVGMASFAAREQVTAVMAGMKDFDPDLKFGPGDSEAEYRQREAERRAYIAAEQAKHTPQGDLNASGGAVGQMADAAAHGAANNPEFQQRWDKLTASTDALRAQLIRDGKDVSQFDAHLREDLRAIMRAKHIPDAQIDALLAAHHDNPLDAVKAFVAEQKGVIGDKEISDLSRKAQEYKDATEEKPVGVSAPTPQASIPASALDAMADLKSLGVVATAHDTDAPPAHGVTVAIAANMNQGINVRS